jgi:hypothetical protein
MSKCFKDTHPKFEVAGAQNITFRLDSVLVAALAKGRDISVGGGVALYARRTLLRADDVVLPARFVPLSKRTNTYFEASPIAQLETSGDAAGQITLTVKANEIWTISTVKGAGSRGDGSQGPSNGLAPVPMPRPWHSSSSAADHNRPGDTSNSPRISAVSAAAALPQCFALTGQPVDSPLVLSVPAMDQQGVWESRPSRDASAVISLDRAVLASTSPATSMQQVVPIPPDEWHHGCGVHPYSFVGPAVNLTAAGSTSNGSTVSVDVLPSVGWSNGTVGWAGVGFGRPTAKAAPVTLALRVWSNGTWAFAGKTGVVEDPPSSSGSSSSGGGGDGGGGGAKLAWYSLSVHIAPWPSPQSNKPNPPTYTAKVNGKVVASGSQWAGALPSRLTSFATLSSSYSGNSNSEFKNLCLDVVETNTPDEPSPTPTPAPAPPSPAPAGHGVTYIDKAAGCATNSGEFWTFSGEDKGEVGTLRPAVNSTLCLDLDGKYVGGELALVVCSSEPSSKAYKSQRWGYDSTHGGVFTSQETRPCKKGSGQCRFCLDLKHKGLVDLFDCKPGDANQIWVFDCAGGAGPVSHKGGCLAATA